MNGLEIVGLTVISLVVAVAALWLAGLVDIKINFKKDEDE